MKPYERYKILKRKYRTTIVFILHKDQYITFDEDAQIVNQLCNIPLLKNHKLKVYYKNITTILKTLIPNSDLHSDQDLGFTRVALYEPLHLLNRFGVPDPTLLRQTNKS